MSKARQPKDPKAIAREQRRRGLPDDQAQINRIQAAQRQGAAGAIVSGGVRELTEDEMKDQVDTRGVIDGSAIDWRDETYIDPRTGTQWDGGDLFARDMAEMLTRNHRAKAIELALTQPIKRATWKLVPGEGDSGEAKDTEEKLRRTRRAGGPITPIQVVIGQMCTATWARRAFFGKAYKLDTKANDGSALYTDIAMRPASTCRLVRNPPDGVLLGFEQDINLYTMFDKTETQQTGTKPGEPIRFKLSQSVVVIHGVDRDPISGVSDLDVAYWCWRTRQKILALYLDYLAGNALPRTLIKHAGDAEAARQAAQTIAALRSSGVGYYDGNNLTVDTLDVSGSGQAATVFMDGLRYMDECQYDSTLTGFLGLASSATRGRGSNALALSATDFFMDGREAFATELEEVLTEQVVGPLVLHNHGPDASFPTFKFDPLNGIDDAKVFTLLTAFANATQSAVPQEFIDELAISAARLLDMDMDKIKDALKEAATAKVEAAKAAGAGQAGQDAAGMGGAVDKARQLIESHPSVQAARKQAVLQLKAGGTVKQPTPAGV